MDEKNETVAESMSEIQMVKDEEFTIVEGFKPDQKIRLGSLTAGDLIEWSEANEGEAKRTAGLRLLCKSIVNSKGERIADDPKNIQLFKQKSHKVTERLIKEVLKLNGMQVPGEVQQQVKKD